MNTDKKIGQSSSSRWILLLSVALCAALGSSCSLIRLKQEVGKLNERGVVAIHTMPAPGAAPIYAVAWPANTRLTNEMVGFQQVASDGNAVFLLLQSRKYDIGVFEDRNGNGTYEGGEPAALAREVQPTAINDPTVTARVIELVLTTTNLTVPHGQTLQLPRENQELGEALPIRIGEIADLDDPQFAAPVGDIGMWQPFEFLRQHGFAIYFLEKYDPKKLPVLFVYGISGSFQDWRPILEKLDRKKYQPWLFLYPGGFRLDKSANTLAALMVLLQQRYPFEQMAVVAHSMGGLVARGAIQRAVQQSGTNFISEFVSLSTPWGGHAAAQMGVKYLEYPVPAWRDMAPNSDYLRNITATALPVGTRHHLIFGFKTSGGLGLPNDNDGVVGVASELVVPIQEQAASLLGLPLDHAEILRAPLVLKKIETVLSR